MNQNLLITIGVAVAIVLTGVWIEFGGITPCALLKYKIKAEMFAVQARSTSELRGLTALMGAHMVDAQMNEMTQGQCIRGLQNWNEIRIDIVNSEFR